MSSSAKPSVLFICLGNICRSPMAEAVFLDLLKKRGDLHEWTVDSAAMIDYHVGKGQEPRTTETLKKNGITEYKHTVRQITKDDFKKFDYIFGMDEDNMSDLQSMSRHVRGGATAKLERLGTYDPEGEKIIVDPYYYKGTEMFDLVYKQCVRACQGFLDKIANK